MNFVILLGVILMAVIGTFLGGALLWSGRPDLATVDLDQPDRLVVHPLGPMKYLGFHGAIDVPLSAVTAAEVADTSSVPTGIKLGGTGLPGVMQAGTFRRDGERRFWLVGKAKQVLVISLEGEKFDQVVAQVADPAASAASIVKAAGVR